MARKRGSYSRSSKSISAKGDLEIAMPRENGKKRHANLLGSGTLAEKRTNIRGIKSAKTQSREKKMMRTDERP